VPQSVRRRGADSQHRAPTTQAARPRDYPAPARPTGTARQSGRRRPRRGNADWAVLAPLSPLLRSAVPHPRSVPRQSRAGSRRFRGCRRPAGDGQPRSGTGAATLTASEGFSSEVLSPGQDRRFTARSSTALTWAWRSSSTRRWASARSPNRASNAPQRGAAVGDRAGHYPAYSCGSQREWGSYRRRVTRAGAMCDEVLEHAPQRRVVPNLSGAGGIDVDRRVHHGPADRVPGLTGELSQERALRAAVALAERVQSVMSASRSATW